MLMRASDNVSSMAYDVSVVVCARIYRSCGVHCEGQRGLYTGELAWVGVWTCLRSAGETIGYRGVTPIQ